MSWVGVPFLAASCGVVSGHGGSPGGQGDPIINGVADTTHPSVMALVRTDSCGSACTGTMIAKSGTTGWFLTAAHCVAPNPEACPGDPGPAPSALRVLAGNDYTSPTAQYPVTEFRIHPSYSATAYSIVYDFAMVRVTGVGGSTPVTPILQPAEDSLAHGTPVTLVGYGRTQATPQNQNSRRYRIDRPINDLRSLLFGYSLQGGGTCQGDSGGPALVTVGGSERVAGVTSYVIGNCDQAGYSGRITAVSSWVQGVVDGTGGGGGQSCDECLEAATTGVGECVGAVDACRGQPECFALWSCLGSCSQGDTGCARSCTTTHAAGVPAYDAIFDCACTSPACATECAESLCRRGCGLNFGVDACGSCVDTHCCDEVAACAADGTCPSCFMPAPPASCRSNHPEHRLSRCVVQNCRAACGLARCGLESSTPACSSCLEQRCCNETLNCISRQACFDCAVGNTSAGCGTDPQYTAFYDCLQGGCGDASVCNLPPRGTGGTGATGGAGGTGAGGAGGLGGESGAGAGGGAGAGTGGAAGESGAGGGDAGPGPVYVPARSESGCGCRVASTPRTDLAFALASALTALALARPRRRAR